MALLRYQKPVDGVPDPGRSLSSSISAQVHDRGSKLLKAVGTADRDRRVKYFEVSSRWQFPLYLTLQLLSSGATWYPVPGTRVCTHMRTRTRGRNFHVV